MFEYIPDQVPLSAALVVIMQIFAHSQISRAGLDSTCGKIAFGSGVAGTDPGEQPAEPQLVPSMRLKECSNGPMSMELIRCQPCVIPLKDFHTSVRSKLSPADQDPIPPQLFD
jgi:hypothetical protein